MGLSLKRNRVGLYQAKDGINDTLQHDGWITEDEVKKIIIERLYQKFIHNVIEVDMEFPHDYYINGKIQRIDKLHQRGIMFVLENWGQPIIDERFKEICDRLKIEL